MNLDYTEEQKSIKEQIGKLLREQCDITVVRGVIEGKVPDYDRKLWSSLGELGWLAAGTPEQHGGMALDPVFLCGMAEELGLALAPVPVASSVFLAAEIVREHGSDEQQQKLLPQLGTGAVIGTFALWEGPGGLRPKVAAQVRDGKLYGFKSPVADGVVADIAVVAAVTAGSKDPALFMVNLDQPGVRRTPLHTMDPTRPAARLDFSGARVEPLAATGWADIEKAVDRAAIFCAFEQVGGAGRALQEAVAYANARYAFGRPIGGFQAIRHRLADVCIQVELARSNAYHGAWALNTPGADLPIAACIARISATRAFELAAREMLHVHGGFGMTWESDCHLFYRRSRQLAVSLGGAGDWSDRLVGILDRQPRVRAA